MQLQPKPKSSRPSAVRAAVFALLIGLMAAHACFRDAGLAPHPEVPECLTILCLGDSYTRGTGVPLAMSFPYQLRDSLAARGAVVCGLHVVAQAGWRTDQLAAALAADTVVYDTVFGLVTLCIGVNNQYQNRDTAQYRLEFEGLLQQALALSGHRQERVVVLSVPDWAFTPIGQQSSSPQKISGDIDRFNAINAEVSAIYGVVYVDVTATSRLGVAMPDLVSADRLHPSGLQYTWWVQKILLQIRLPD